MSHRYGLIVSDEHGRFWWRILQREAPYALIRQGEARSIPEAIRIGEQERDILEAPRDSGAAS